AFLPPFFKGGQGGIFRQCLEIIRLFLIKALPIPQALFLNLMTLRQSLGTRKQMEVLLTDRIPLFFSADPGTFGEYDAGAVP
ncbi:MAG: hypothetical protein ACLFTV_14675, partial [Desulfococcaceae bacterium]